MTTQRRKRMKALVSSMDEIPADLLAYLRRGPGFIRPAGERQSELCRDLLHNWTAEDVLAFMSEVWAKHESLIRQGVDGEPFVIPEMRRWRNFLYGREEEYGDEQLAEAF